MTEYRFAQPVPGPRIVPFGENRLASDVLPNGRPAFRVTQRFDDVNPALPQLGAHRAVDLGNFNCGDPVYAVWAGRANTIGPDQYGALGIVIDHGSFSTVYWHLNAFSIPRGTAIPVSRGQQIGIVGKTGIGAVCHLHFEVKVNAVRIDPYPYLFGAPLVLEDDVNIPSGLKHALQAVLGPRNRLRADPMTTEGSRILGDSSLFVQVYGFGVPGEPWNLGGVAGDTYAWVGVFGQTWFVAEPLLTDIGLTKIGQNAIPADDCSAVEAELTVARTKLAQIGESVPALRATADAIGRIVTG